MNGSAPRRLGPAGEFGAGVVTLLRGFGLWGRRPGVMLLGLVPALIVGLLLVAAFIALVAVVPGLVTWATPFADDWDAVWQTLLRVVLGIAVLSGAVVVMVLTFTGLTLAVGDPFYERIWRAAEEELGDPPAGEGAGFWRALADGLWLTARSIVVALAVALVSLVPLAGTVLAAVLGTALGGWLLAGELTTRALEARGMAHRQRHRALASRRARTLGFGVAVQLCFLIPGGAVLVMPAAVAGATRLARAVAASGSPVAPR